MSCVPCLEKPDLCLLQKYLDLPVEFKA